MSDIMKAAIIGFGNRGRRYLFDIRDCLGGKVEVIAIADPDIEGVKARLADIDHSAKIYATPRELIVAEKDIDGIIIASPDDKHLESFQAVAHLRKPLLMEKPLEGNPEQFTILAEALKKYKAPVLVGHCMRHSPILRRAKELIDQGVIGMVTSMRFVQNCHYGSNFFRGWHRRTKAITSLYLEKATHDFDIMHMLNGDNYASDVFAFSKRYKFGGGKPNDLKCSSCPEEITCPESLLNMSVTVYGDNAGNVLSRVGRDKCVWAKEIDINDDDMCMIEFSNGVQGTYIQTFYTPSNYKGRVYTIVGDAGVMEIDMGHTCGKIVVTSCYDTCKDKTEYKFDYLGRNHYNGDTYLVRNFLGIMQGSESPRTTAEAAIAAEMLGLAAVKSSKSRQLEKVVL